MVSINPPGRLAIGAVAIGLAMTAAVVAVQTSATGIDAPTSETLSLLSADEAWVVDTIYDTAGVTDLSALDSTRVAEVDYDQYLSSSGAEGFQAQGLKATQKVVVVEATGDFPRPKMSLMMGVKASEFDFSRMVLVLDGATQQTLTKYFDAGATPAAAATAMSVDAEGDAPALASFTIDELNVSAQELK